MVDTYTLYSGLVQTDKCGKCVSAVMADKNGEPFQLLYYEEGSNAAVLGDVRPTFVHLEKGQRVSVILRVE